MHFDHNKSYFKIYVKISLFNIKTVKNGILTHTAIHDQAPRLLHYNFSINNLYIRDMMNGLLYDTQQRLLSIPGEENKKRERSL